MNLLFSVIVSSNPEFRIDYGLILGSLSGTLNQNSVFPQTHSRCKTETFTFQFIASKINQYIYKHIGTLYTVFIYLYKLNITQHARMCILF